MLLTRDDLLRMDFQNYNFNYSERVQLFDLYKYTIREISGKNEQLETRCTIIQDEYKALRIRFDELQKMNEKLSSDIEELQNKKLTIKQRILGKI